MFFHDIYKDTIYACFFFDNDDPGITIASANTTFENINTTENISLDFVNKNLDILQYEVSFHTVRVAFIKNAYFKLFKSNTIDSTIKFDIPYIINLHIFYDNCSKYSKLQFKIIGVYDNKLKILSIPNDYFEHIETMQGYEIVEKSKLDEKQKELTKKLANLERFRRGLPPE